MTASRDEFLHVYDGVVSEVIEYWSPAMQDEVARHNRAWLPGRYDFVAYLRSSGDRFYRAYRACADVAGRSVCDVGGMWGVFSMTLQRLGYRSIMTECLRFYSGAFDELFAHIADSGVFIQDVDPFEPDADLGRGHGAVTLLAVLEHYPHSPATLLANVRRALGSDGVLYVEVPNIAYWPHRLELLRGRSPLVSAEVVYESAVPFTGHHHEYTQAELDGLLQRAGYDIVARDAFTYSADWGSGLKGRVLDRFGRILTARRPATNELISVSCRPSGAGSP